MTLVSVVVCAYNAADTLGRALDSALAQSMDRNAYEVVLVDDGSSDGTPALAAAYAERHPALRYHRLEANEGLVAACNLGLAKARGEYFIRLDADDSFHPDMLSRCLPPLEAGETDLVYCDRYDVTLPEGGRKLVSIEQFNIFSLIAIGTMMRTQMVRDVGGYRDLFWEEYDLYLRYFDRSGKSPVRIAEPLYYYSRHPGSMTADAARVQRGWDELREEWGDETLRGHGWPNVLQEA